MKKKLIVFLVIVSVAAVVILLWPYVQKYLPTGNGDMMGFSKVELKGMDSKCNLGDFGGLIIYGGDQLPALGYRLPRWLKNLHPDVRWKHVVIEVKGSDPYGGPEDEWRKYPGAGMGTNGHWAIHPEGNAAIFVYLIIKDWKEKTFYVRVSVLDETGRWDKSPEVSVTLYPLKRKK